MCLIVFAYRSHPAHPLILVMNRDEYKARRTKTLHQWPNQICGGQDLQHGGSWLATHPSGKYAAITTHRCPEGIADFQADRRSRGLLITDYLESSFSAQQYAEHLLTVTTHYNTFNMLIGDKDSLHYYSSSLNLEQTINPGIYGLSNGLFNEPWPKLKRARQLLSQHLDDEKVNHQALIKMMQNSQLASDEELPETGISTEKERQLSAMCIKLDDYATRSISAMTIHHDNQIEFSEKNMLSGGFETLCFRCL